MTAAVGGRLLELWQYTPVLLLVVVLVAVLFGKTVIKTVITAAVVIVAGVWLADYYHTSVAAALVQVFPDMPRGWIPW